MEKFVAVVLLRRWGAAEAAEARNLGYPSVSSAFRDHAGGYRTSSVVTLDDDHWIEKAGAAVNALHPALRTALRSEYVSGGVVPFRVRGMALDAFRRKISAL